MRTFIGSQTSIFAVIGVIVVVELLGCNLVFQFGLVFSGRPGYICYMRSWMKVRLTGGLETDSRRSAG